MEFVKLDDVKKMLQNGKMIDDLKVYKAKQKGYIPLMIKDYGAGEEIREVGADINHDWLEITDEGSLKYYNMQGGFGSHNEEIAKLYKAVCFVPTYENDKEYGGGVKQWITPRTMLILEEMAE